MEGKKQSSRATPAQVAASFVDQYYLILSKSPENVHKFYKEPSLLAWPRADGVVKAVTTLTGINTKIMSTDYKDCSVEVKTTEAQESQDGGIIIVVTGCLTGKDDSVRKNFSQTFFLAKQENGFFILNDILRIFDVIESKTDATGGKADKIDPSASLKSSVLASAARCDTCRRPPPLNIRAALQNVKGPSVVTPPSHAMKNTYASALAKTAPAISPRVEVAPTTNAPSPRGNASTSKSKVTPKSPTTVGQGSSTSKAKGIYIGGLPYEITKQEIVDVVRQFGIVQRSSETVQIRRHEDGFCCGFVEFESADSARRAVEAHRVMFGDKEAYISYKRSQQNNQTVK